MGMNKTICALLCMCLLTTLWGMDIVTKTRDRQTSLYMTIPMETFIWPAKDNLAKYQIMVSVSNAKKDNVYQNVLELRLDKSKIPLQSALLKEIKLALPEGNYQLNVQIRNPELGDKKTSKHEFKVDYSTVPGSVALLIADNGDYQFVPSDYATLDAKLVAAELVLDTNPEIDSLLIQADNAFGSSVTTLYPPFARTFDLLPVLQSGKVFNVSLRYYAANILYKSETLINKKEFKYNQVYSLQDQLQQIRYIADQNEWRAIKDTADDQLKARLDEFWLRHNPHPDDTTNPSREVFYSRVIKADELFTIHKKLKGWKSDRGKIFIQYGQPDEIVGDIYPSGRYPYIKWYYYQEYKVFSFVDKSGYGNYKLTDVWDENEN
jgi:GWxTD domain-containing protein